MMQTTYTTNSTDDITTAITTYFENRKYTAIKQSSIIATIESMTGYARETIRKVLIEMSIGGVLTRELVNFNAYTTRSEVFYRMKTTPARKIAVNITTEKQNREMNDGRAEYHTKTRRMLSTNTTFIDFLQEYRITFPGSSRTRKSLAKLWKNTKIRTKQHKIKTITVPVAKKTPEVSAPAGKTPKADPSTFESLLMTIVNQNATIINELYSKKYPASTIVPLAV